MLPNDGASVVARRFSVPGVLKAIMLLQVHFPGHLHHVHRLFLVQAARCVNNVRFVLSRLSSTCQSEKVSHRGPTCHASANIELSFFYLIVCLRWELQASAAGRRQQGMGHGSNKALPCVTSTRRGTSSVSRTSKSSQGAQAIKAVENGVQGNLGNNENRDVSVRHPPAEQGCTQELKDWTDTLSKDNVALASEVMQLRTMLAAEKENGCVLGDRVEKLQVSVSFPV